MDDGVFGERHLVCLIQYLKDAVGGGGALLYRADDAAEHSRTGCTSRPM